MTALQEWRLTFGARYARLAHPYLPQAHPDGWVTVWAVDEATARRAAATRLGLFWSAIYPAQPFGNFPVIDWSLYPLGELAVLNPDDMPTRMRHLRAIDEAIGHSLAPLDLAALYDRVIVPMLAEAEICGAVHGLPVGDETASGRT